VEGTKLHIVMLQCHPAPLRVGAFGDILWDVRAIGTRDARVPMR
jgi:hypothetical protein